MKILQVSTADRGSGAELVAWNLFREFRARGAESWLAVGRRGDMAEPGVFEIHHRASRNPWSRFWYAAESALPRIRGRGRAALAARWLADLDKWNERRRGLEDFQFPGTHRLLEKLPSTPDIIHLHNLHGGYFDPRVLPEWSRRFPVFVTLHDKWLFTGHCAYSLGCERWQIGCGQCPDLELYQRLERDGSHQNWLRKQTIFSQARLRLISPSRWLLEQARQSLLAPAIVDARVIHNGVDRTIFRAGEREAARAKLGLPQDASIVLFSAFAGRENRFKDYLTIREAIAVAKPTSGTRPQLFITLGGAASEERIAGWEVRGFGFEKDLTRVAAFHQAADLYVHAAIEDNFPNTILESLACGTPVLATAVGGIPEQVSEATGRLVPARDPRAMARALESLLADPQLLDRLGEQAARDAAARFDLSRQAAEHWRWYSEVLGGERHAHPAARVPMV